MLVYKKLPHFLLVIHVCFYVKTREKPNNFKVFFLNFSGFYNDQIFSNYKDFHIID